VSEWQPIETAPTDGTAVLLYVRGCWRLSRWAADRANHVTIGFCNSGRWLSVETEDCGSMGGEMTGWMEDHQPIDVEPTHWAPLPEMAGVPPTAKRKGPR